MRAAEVAVVAYTHVSLRGSKAIDVTQPLRGRVAVNRTADADVSAALSVRTMSPLSVPEITSAVLRGETAMALMRPPSGIAVAPTFSHDSQTAALDKEVAAQPDSIGRSDRA